MNTNKEDKQYLKHLNEKLKRVFIIKPRPLIFIKVAEAQQYDYVLQQLNFCAKETNRTYASILMQKDEDILAQISRREEECLLIELDPLDEGLLKRLDFLRERLYNSGKLLIFVLYMNQYDTLMCNYPDLYEYSTLNFDYSGPILVPFTLIFSNDSFSFDRKQMKEPMNSFSVRPENVPEEDYLYNVFLGVKKLRTMRMKSKEIVILDDMVSKLYKKKKLYSSNQVINLLFDYIDLLCMKEEYEKAEDNLRKLFSNGLGQKFHFFFFSSKREWTIDHIFLCCFGVNNDFSEQVVSECLRTCKILMMLYAYTEDLVSAELINKKRIQLLKGRDYLSDNLRAEACNDDIIIQYLKNKDVKKCISDIDYMKHLDTQIDLHFLYYYNKAILYLLDNDYQNALHLCEKYLMECRALSNIVPGMHFYRISLIQNWIEGMYYRELDKAIEQNVLILQEHRNTFSENHYSIAEIHFCNAILYQELGEDDKSQHCAEKANNILAQNKSKRLERLRQLVHDFLNSEIIKNGYGPSSD